MASLSELDRLRIVLVGIRNPLNLGAAARAMSNFGASRLRVVRPFEPSFREARSAVGPAADILARSEMFATVPEAVADCTLVVGTSAIQHRQLQHPMCGLDAAAQQIRQHLAMGNVALLFGSEKTGLANEDLSHCHWLLHIPARDEHLSMNLGQAVAVTMYELARAVQPLPSNQQEAPSESGQLERITEVLVDALHTSGFASSETLAATTEKTRRLVRRMNLSGVDAEVLLGMLRQIIWKLRSP